MLVALLLACPSLPTTLPRPAPTCPTCPCPPSPHRSKLASEFLYNAVRVTIGSQDLSANHAVKQVGG